MRITTLKQGLFTLILLLMIIPRAAMADKEYRFTQLTIQAQLHADGSMSVEENRTFEFEGSFRYAFRTFPKSDEVTFTDFRISEDGRPYILSGDGSPGSFEIREGKNETELRWHFRAGDETRTFTVHYRVLDAVRSYDDASVLYFQFVSGEWDRPSNRVSVTVTPPAPPSDSPLAWLHGPLWADIRIAEDGTLYAWCERLPRRTRLEIRAIYPQDLFPGAFVRGGALRQAILDEEAEWAEEANRMREAAVRKREERDARWNTGKWIMLALSAAGLFVWWNIYRTYHNKPQTPPIPAMDSAIPDRVPPALLDYLIHSRTIYGTALIGTMLDLARRGFLALREEKREARGLFGGVRTQTRLSWELKRSHLEKNGSSLEPYEESLIRFLFDNLAGGADSLSLKEIEKKSSAFMKFFSNWQKEVKAAGKKKGWFDLNSYRGMNRSILAGVFWILLTVPSAFLYGPWAALVAFSGLLMVFLSLAIPVRTEEGEKLALQWKALKKYLKHVHLRQDAFHLLSSIDQYLVYGVVLGLSQKAIRNLALMIPEDRYAHFLPWYITSGGRGGFSPEAFSSSLSSAISVTTSAMSSAAGAGGGASAGGGGGASSGGGGAG